MAHHWRVDAWGNHDGVAGDLLGVVLYWPLGLELAHMTSKAWIGIVVIGLFSFLVAQGRGWGSILWLLLGAVWLSYCLGKDT